MSSEFEVLPEETPETSADSEAHNNPNDQTTSQGKSPGVLLREAREKRELTIQDIVTQSRMSKETVKALEEDRDPPQNAWVYVRGYYRKYARVLGISEEEILQAHERLAGGAPEPQPVSAEWAPQDVSPGGGVPKIVLVLVIGIVLGGIAWWAMPALMGDKQDEAGTPELSPQKSLSLPAPAAETRVIPPKVSTPAQEAVVSAPQAAEPEAPAPVAEPEVAAQPDEEPSSPVEEIHNDVHEAAAASDQPKLALEFLDRSWVNIVDAAGNKLLDGIVRANVQLALEGQPPFKVFLGYAPGVKLSYKGETIDTSAYTASNNTARFTVGEDATATP